MKVFVGKKAFREKVLKGKKSRSAETPPADKFDFSQKNSLGNLKLPPLIDTWTKLRWTCLQKKKDSLCSLCSNGFSMFFSIAIARIGSSKVKIFKVILEMKSHV